MSDLHSPSEIQERLSEGAVPKVVVTRRRGSPRSEALAHTAEGLPDYIVKPLSMLHRLAIRAAKVYISTLLGVLGYGAVAAVSPLPLPEFQANFTNAAQLAVAPTVINMLINMLIIFTKLDESLPEAMG